MSTDDLSCMLGKTMKSVTAHRFHGPYDDHLVFETLDGTQFVFYFYDTGGTHEVRLEDINGDLEDLVGSPLLVAEMYQSDPVPGRVLQDPDWCQDEDTMWTFYRFATHKGGVDVRWFGCSNGYYSTEVSFKVVVPKGKTE